MEVYIRADQIPSGRKFHNVFLKQLIAASEGVTGNAYFLLIGKKANKPIELSLSIPTGSALIINEHFDELEISGSNIGWIVFEEDITQLNKFAGIPIRGASNILPITFNSYQVAVNTKFARFADLVPIRVQTFNIPPNDTVWITLDAKTTMVQIIQVGVPNINVFTNLAFLVGTDTFPIINGMIYPIGADFAIKNLDTSSSRTALVFELGVNIIY